MFCIARLQRFSIAPQIRTERWLRHFDRHIAVWRYGSPSRFPRLVDAFMPRFTKVLESVAGQAHAHQRKPLAFDCNAVAHSVCTSHTTSCIRLCFTTMFSICVSEHRYSRRACVSLSTYRRESCRIDPGCRGTLSWKAQACCKCAPQPLQYHTLPPSCDATRRSLPFQPVEQAGASALLASLQPRASAIPARSHVLLPEVVRI